MGRTYNSAAFKQRYARDSTFRERLQDASRRAYLKRYTGVKAKWSAIRDRAIAVYGGTCVDCGSINDLEFDHVHGNGNEHRKSESSQQLMRRIAQTGVLSDVDLQLLCRPCHVYKGKDAAYVRSRLAHNLQAAYKAYEWLERRSLDTDFWGA